MTPAETPTEVCVECQRLTVTGHGTFPYAGGHTLALHARIRELVGALRTVLKAHGDHREGMDPNRECGCFSCEQGRAALARSEGGT